MDPNPLLDALIDEAGMSHAGLAARINRATAQRGGRSATRYDHTAVGRWIRRGERPRGQVPDLICEILGQRLGRTLTLDDVGMGTSGSSGTPTELSGFVDRATALWRSDARQQPEVQAVQPVTGTAAVLPVWEWENPPDDADVSRPGVLRVGQADVQMLRTARTRYERMYRSAGGVATRTRVAAFMTEHAAPLVRGAYTDAIGRDLLRAAGGLAAIAGICAYDSDAQGLAQRYLHQALRLAKASADRAFGGYVIALLVNQAIYLRDYRQAIQFAEAGVRASGPHISPALATDLHAMQAKAFARMGDATAAHAAMARAESAAGRIRRNEEPPETGYVQPGLVEAQLAEALISLGDWVPARQYAEEAVQTQAHPRGRVHRLATLTTVDLGHGDADQAAAHAVGALDLASGMESARLRDRFVALRKRLADTGSAATTEAVDRIDDALSVPL